MKNHFLTTPNFISGKFFSILESFRPGQHVMTTNKLGTGTWIKKQNKENLTSVGIFRKGNKKVIVKHVAFEYKNLIVEQLINEASMLSLLGELATTIERKVRFPKLVKLSLQKGNGYLMSEYIEGKKLSVFSNTKKVAVLREIQFALREMSSNIPSEIEKNLPTRSMALVWTLYFFYIAKLKMRGIDIPSLSFITKLFVKNMLFSLFSSRKFVLSHKDLHDENIILGKNINVIDPEVSVLTDRMTDMAHIARYYAGKMTPAQVNELLKDVSIDNADKMRFVSLTIFYSIQMMAIRKIDDPDFIEADTYLRKYFVKIYDQISIKRPFGEALYFAGLNILSNFKLNKLTTPVILCYHSISDDGWRFSTSPNSFKGQLDYLKQHRQVVPLAEIIKKQKAGSVSLTFDDGYEDFQRNALPILNKASVKGTLFVLGSNKPNRRELDNRKKLLTIDQVKKMRNNGWEIGFHSATHADLTKLSEDALQAEISGGKQIAEKNLGFTMRYFAYPKGNYNNHTISAVKAAGFKGAFSTDGGSISKDKEFHNDRICVEGALSQKEFETLITKEGIFFNRLFIKLLHIKVSILELWKANFDKEISTEKVKGALA